MKKTIFRVFVGLIILAGQAFAAKLSNLYSAEEKNSLVKNCDSSLPIQKCISDFDPKNGVLRVNPFRLCQKNPTERQYVFFHGLTDSPGVFRDIAKSLQEMKCSSSAAPADFEAPLLSGMGTRFEDQNKVKPEDLIRDVRWTLKNSDNVCRQDNPTNSRKKFFVGLSMGSVLATLAALDPAFRGGSREEVEGLLLLSPAFSSGADTWSKIQLGTACELPSILLDWKLKKPVLNAHPELFDVTKGDIRYGGISGYGACMLKSLQEILANTAKLRKISRRIPVRAVFVADDSLIDITSSIELLAQIAPHAEVVLMGRGERSGEVEDLILSKNLKLIKVASDISGFRHTNFVMSGPFEDFEIRKTKNYQMDFFPPFSIRQEKEFQEKVVCDFARIRN